MVFLGNPVLCAYVKLANESIELNKECKKVNSKRASCFELFFNGEYKMTLISFNCESTSENTIKINFGEKEYILFQNLCYQYNLDDNSKLFKELNSHIRLAVQYFSPFQFA
jgi:hypothetical protein